MATWKKNAQEIQFPKFLGWTAFAMGIVTLNPTMCCGIYGNAYLYFLTSILLLLLGAAYISKHHH